MNIEDLIREGRAAQMSQLLKEDQEEQGRWLLVLIVLLYALVGLAVKHYPLNEAGGPKSYVEYLALAGPDDCDE